MSSSTWWRDIVTKRLPVFKLLIKNVTKMMTSFIDFFSQALPFAQFSTSYHMWKVETNVPGWGTQTHTSMLSLFNLVPSSSFRCKMKVKRNPGTLWTYDKYFPRKRNFQNQLRNTWTTAILKTSALLQLEVSTFSMYF